MAILVVDDSPAVRKMIKAYLQAAGLMELLFAGSAQEALQVLGIGAAAGNAGPGVDLMLLDIILPDMDGREVCRIIKSEPRWQDLPVIMVTSLTEMEDLEKAFTFGAIDYITKPVHSVELLARVRSALKLKEEMDRRRAREMELLAVTRELEAAVARLNELSNLDGLTAIGNRRRFDEYINQEWNRGLRNARPLSLIMADIDFFKFYNDRYGHQAGDDCLRAIGGAMRLLLNRPGDLACRYGGEEFALILPETPSHGAMAVARRVQAAVAGLGIIHESSPVNHHLTVSLGLATTLPGSNSSPHDLIAAADAALYQAKRHGRNRVEAGLPGGGDENDLPEV